MSLFEDNILKECNRLEEEIRRICHFLRLKVPDALGVDAARTQGGKALSNIHYKTLDTNLIYQIIELSSYSNNKDVLCKIVNDAFLKMENARLLASSPNIENALKELCGGFMMAGLAYAKLYSSGSSMTASEAAVRSNANGKINKDELVEIAVVFLQEWNDFSSKITVKFVVEKISCSMTQENKYIKIIKKNWPKASIHEDGSNLRNFEEPLKSRLTAYFSREKKLKDLMRVLKAKSRQNKR